MARTQTDSNSQDLVNKIAELEALVKQLSQQNTSVQYQEVDDDIKSDKLIRVMSLCNHQLNLSTSNEKGARHWTFNRFGEVKQIPYNMLLQIIENHPTFTESGIYYIMNKDVVRKHGLLEFYDNILTKEKMDDIINANDREAVEVYKTANKRQKEIINTMIVEKVRDGEEIDLNIVYAIGRAGGIDLVAKADEAKQFMAEMANPPA